MTNGQKVLNKSTKKYQQEPTEVAKYMHFAYVWDCKLHFPAANIVAKLNNWGNDERNMVLHIWSWNLELPHGSFGNYVIQEG